MRWILYLFSLLTVAAPVVAPVTPRVIDTRTSLYYEDAVEPRPIASVTAELVVSGADTRLRVAVAAIGEGVDPVPGLEGASGANLRTAEELDQRKDEDPIIQLKGYILENKLGDLDILDGIDEAVKREVLESVDFAENSPLPPLESIYEDIYVQEDYPFLTGPTS